MLEFTCQYTDGRQETVRLNDFKCFCDGYTGRDKASLEQHIAELEADLGVPRPTRVPTCYPMMTRLVMIDPGTIEVYGSHTSGEIEAVLIVVDGRPKYVGVGSDQTDREFERFSIPVAKNVCPKVLSRRLWSIADVVGVWDQLELRSWIDGEPYQAARLGAMLSLDELIKAVPGTRLTKQAVIMSGTIPTLSGLRFGTHFRGSLTDTQSGRELDIAYEVTVVEPIS